jgi:hypothetical protein
VTVKRDFVNYIMPTEQPAFKPPHLYMGAYQVIWAVAKDAPHKEEAIKVTLALNKSIIA